MTIRTATHLDQEAIHRIHWSAFEDNERDRVAKLAIDLLLETTSPKIISLVAELEGHVVGHVAFSPVKIENDEMFQGFILAPLGIMPDYQRRGFGSMLVEAGIKQVSHMGADTLFVYGDPHYYHKFGFSAEAATQYRPSYKLAYPFGWQAISLAESSARTTSADIVVTSVLRNAALW